jgi:hypothetical protein
MFRHFCAILRVAVDSEPDALGIVYFRRQPGGYHKSAETYVGTEIIKTV